MKRLSSARAEVLDAVSLLAAERVPLASALGLALAEKVIANEDVPPFDNSAMDGYAVQAADTKSGPVELRVIEDVAAGHLPRGPVQPGTAIKIMTGAPIPDGADAVVKVEDTEQVGDVVRVVAGVDSGANVRSAGGDVMRGTEVFSAGTELTPAHIGVLATLGITGPLVYRRARVALLSTGDEVAPPETEDLRPGWIRDANRPLLTALLEELGAEVHDFGIVGDDAGRLRATLLRAAGDCDAIITSGGVSMGEYDLVKQVLTELGGIELWRVAMKPAKPFAFGSIRRTPLFGLPGNPVSVLVAFEQFARPALRRMMGLSLLYRPRLCGVLAEDISTDPEKTVFLRVLVEQRDGRWVTRSAGSQGSNVLSAAAAADAFAVVPVGVGELSAGDPVTLEMFRWPSSRTREEVEDE